MAKARKIGRDDMKPIGEQRNQVAEHVAGGREAVQQEQLRRALIARLAIEHFAAVDLGGAVVDGGHRRFSFRSMRGRIRPLTTAPIASRMMSMTRPALSRSACDRQDAT